MRSCTDTTGPCALTLVCPWPLDDDPSKAFPPTTCGVVLGVTFDTDEWTWYLPEEKQLRLLHHIEVMIHSESCTMWDIWSVVGKILNVMPLVNGGKYNISHLLKLNSMSEDGYLVVSLTQKEVNQLHWWLLMLKLTYKKSKIPRESGSPKPWSRVGDSDPGGSRETIIGNGLGVVVGQKWCYLPWPKFVNEGRMCKYCGKNWAHKLTFLEYVGHLVRILVDIPDCIGKPIVTRIDNAGCYYVDKNGYHLK